MHRKTALLAASLASAAAVFAGATASSEAPSLPPSVVYLRSDHYAYLMRRLEKPGVDIDDPRKHRKSRDDRQRRRRGHQSKVVDDPAGCSLYAAPSAIPNSGLGMYTTTSVSSGDMAGQPEIGISALDPHSNHPEVIADSLLAQYPWHANQLYGSQGEALEAESLIPSLGMLANAHLGLKNTRIDEQVVTQHRGRYDRDEPGWGATSDYFNVFFRASQVIEVEQDFGTELFVDYGESWFTAREDKLGFQVPFAQHFERADELLRKFQDENSASALPEEEHAAKYQNLLAEATEEDPKMQLVMPDEVGLVEDVARIGSARYSVPGFMRSIEWLDEHGFCMDNIRGGRSALPQAGNGAFAARSLSKGSLVVRTPVLTIHRDHMIMYKPVTPTPPEREGTNRFLRTEEVIGDQLLLNYCFGHVESSLLFFPYTSSVQFINHARKAEGAAGGDGDDADPSANAEIRWSQSEFHDESLLLQPLEDIHARMKTGLMFDIVATRDIRLGEEVLVDYGPDWSAQWKEHALRWSTADSDEDAKTGSPSPLELNSDAHSPIRTKEEQIDHPYPGGIHTKCFYTIPKDVDDTSGMHHLDTWKRSQQGRELHPCDILVRESYIDESSNGSRIDLYTVSIEIESKTHVIHRVPRYGIRFDYVPYHSSQHSRNTFRHQIDLSEGIIPEHWLDRKGFVNGSL